MVIALYVTVVSDLSTEENRFAPSEIDAKTALNVDLRSQMLYKTFCFKLGIDLIGPQLASMSMGHSLWLPYLLSIVFLLLTLPIILLMPETLGLQRTQVEENEDMPPRLHIYRKFLAKHEIRLGLAIDFIVQLRYNAVQTIPPFMSMKLGWSISKVPF